MFYAILAIWSSRNGHAYYDKGYRHQKKYDGLSSYMDILKIFML
jgi:hypothetical protein